MAFRKSGPAVRPRRDPGTLLPGGGHRVCSGPRVGSAVPSRCGLGDTRGGMAWVPETSSELVPEPVSPPRGSNHPGLRGISPACLARCWQSDYRDWGEGRFRLGDAALSLVASGFGALRSEPWPSARQSNAALLAMIDSSRSEVPRGLYWPVSHSLTVCWRVPISQASPRWLSPRWRRRARTRRASQ